jgi:hypothetical protein
MVKDDGNLSLISKRALSLKGSKATEQTETSDYGLPNHSPQPCLAVISCEGLHDLYKGEVGA